MHFDVLVRDYNILTVDPDSVHIFQVVIKKDMLHLYIYKPSISDSQFTPCNTKLVYLVYFIIYQTSQRQIVLVFMTLPDIHISWVSFTSVSNITGVILTERVYFGIKCTFHKYFDFVSCKWCKQKSNRAMKQDIYISLYTYRCKNCTENGILQDNYVFAIAIDALAPCVARSLAAMILTQQD